jgi:hypothetical protein
LLLWDFQPFTLRDALKGLDCNFIREALSYYRKIYRLERQSGLAMNLKLMMAIGLSYIRFSRLSDFPVTLQGELNDPAKFRNSRVLRIVQKMQSYQPRHRNSDIDQE